MCRLSRNSVGVNHLETQGTVQIRIGTAVNAQSLLLRDYLTKIKLPVSINNRKMIDSYILHVGLIFNSSFKTCVKLCLYVYCDYGCKSL